MSKVEGYKHMDDPIPMPWSPTVPAGKYGSLAKLEDIHRIKIWQRGLRCMGILVTFGNCEEVLGQWDDNMPESEFTTISNQDSSIKFIQFMMALEGFVQGISTGESFVRTRNSLRSIKVPLGVCVTTLLNVVY
jgi:hypothetical protein